MESKRLFLLDGMALVYRAHFAFAVKPIVTSYGLNASAMLGITNTLVELIQKEKPKPDTSGKEASSQTPMMAQYLWATSKSSK